ncbi:MAG: hypothetical protein M3Z24_03915, partial [Chloroflexota bacterium]|nr:hypothetical protein [Chloroflexota bacterium]
MRFSKRSKMSIALSLLALVVLIGAFVGSSMLRGATHTAHAAGVQSGKLERLNKMGTASFKSQPHASGVIGTPSNEIQRSPADKSPQVPVGSGSGGGLPTNPPNPSNTAVTGSNSKFSGFPGLTHADQRLANNGNQFSLEPPDQGLCVGNGSVLETVNDALAAYSVVPGHVYQVPITTLSSFFGLAPAITRTTPPAFGPFVSDPKCYYDTMTQRWFVSVLEIDTNPTTGAFGTHSAVLLAVSQSSSVAGPYTVFSIDTSNGTGSPNCATGCFGDQPLIGADAYGFYVTTNEFPITATGFNGAQIYALSKTGLESAATGGTTPTLVHLDASQALVPFGGLSYSIQPAISPTLSLHEAANGTEYFLSALDFLAKLDNRIATWAVTNTASLANAKPAVSLSVTVIKSETYGQPPAATQKSGPRPLARYIGTITGKIPPLELLNTNDDRMNQVVYADGLLWSGVNTIVGTSSSNRAGIAYFEVNPSVSGSQVSATMARQGYVTVAGQNVFFPSIGVTASGKALMSFTLSGPSYYPSSAYILMNTSGTHGSVHVAGAGALPEDGFTGYAAYGGAGV